MAHALDQLDLGGGQRVEREPGVGVRQHPVARAPHQQHGAADADQVERRGRELRREPAAGLEQGREVRARLAVAPEGVDDRALRGAGGQVGELAVGAGLRAAHEHARDGDGDRQQLADDRVLLDRVEPGGHLEAVGRDGHDAGEPHLAGGLGQPQREAAAERSAGRRRPAHHLPSARRGRRRRRPTGAARRRRAGASPRRSPAGRRRSRAGRGSRAGPAAGARCPRSRSSRAGARCRGRCRRPRAPGCDGLRPRPGAQERTPCSRTYPFIGSPGQAVNYVGLR